MPGVTGREVKSAWARSSTWGTAASVTRQILIASTEGFDDKPQLVEDDAFNQDFIAEAEVGDFTPPTPGVRAQLRYEQLDSWIAGSCGSVAAPVVVSSQAANSLVAYRHTITLAPELAHFFTIAVDTTQYVKELTTTKFRGFTITVGDGGRLMIEFPAVANRCKYDSAVNTNSTVGGAAAATIGNRVFRKQGTWRMNLASGGALGASDVISTLKDFTLTYARPLAQDDHVVGSGEIIEPDDDGALEITLQLNYPRMNTVTANSLALAYGLGTSFKADLSFLGPYVNSTTQRQLLFEFPALQVIEFTAPIVGHNQARPAVTFKARRAAAAPTGMSGITAPQKITIVNTNSANLLA